MSRGVRNLTKGMRTPRRIAHNRPRGVSARCRVMHTPSLGVRTPTRDARNPGQVADNPLRQSRVSGLNGRIPGQNSRLTVAAKQGSASHPLEKMVIALTMKEPVSGSQSSNESDGRAALTPARETRVVLLLISVLLALNLATGARFPCVWLDEVQHTDPAANLLLGHASLPARGIYRPATSSGRAACRCSTPCASCG